MSKHAFEQEQRRDIRVEKDPLAGQGSLEYDYDAVAHALDIRPQSSAVERTIDITTLGARTGTPRRIEVWVHHIDRRWYIAGVPGPRDWYANLRAHPRFLVHLKHGVTADLPATATPVDPAAGDHRDPRPAKPARRRGAGQRASGPRGLARAQPARRDRIRRGAA